MSHSAASTVPWRTLAGLSLQDGLVGSRVAQLSGAVGGEEQQGDVGLPGLHHAGQQVGHRRAAGDDDGGWPDLRHQEGGGGLWVL